ncbi:MULTISPECIES: hypothetical protein [unclassified Microcoleus]
MRSPLSTQNTKKAIAFKYKPTLRSVHPPISAAICGKNSKVINKGDV